MVLYYIQLHATYFVINIFSKIYLDWNMYNASSSNLNAELQSLYKLASLSIIYCIGPILFLISLM